MLIFNFKGMKKSFPLIKKVDIQPKSWPISSLVNDWSLTSNDLGCWAMTFQDSWLMYNISSLFSLCDTYNPHPHCLRIIPNSPPSGIEPWTCGMAGTWSTNEPDVWDQGILTKNITLTNESSYSDSKML